MGPPDALVTVDVSWTCRTGRTTPVGVVRLVDLGGGVTVPGQTLWASAVNDTGLCQRVASVVGAGHGDVVPRTSMPARRPMTVGMWSGVHGTDSCRGAQRSADVVAGCFGGMGMARSALPCNRCVNLVGWGCGDVLARKHCPSRVRRQPAGRWAAV